MDNGNDILNSAEFENQIACLSGDDLIKFVAREQYKVQANCIRCFAMMGKFDERQKQQEKRIDALEAANCGVNSFGFNRKQLSIIGAFVAAGAFLAGFIVKAAEFFFTQGK